MPKFFSYPGSSPVQGNGQPPWSQWVKDVPRYKEFFDGRKATSHQHSGLDVGQDPTKGNVTFKGNAARVVHEEHDAHTGEVKTILHVSGKQPDTREVSWAPVDERRIEIRDNRQIHS